MTNWNLILDKLQHNFLSNRSYCLSRLGGSDTNVLEIYCKLRNAYNNDNNIVRDCIEKLFNGKSVLNINSQHFLKLFDIIKKYNGYYDTNSSIDKIVDNFLTYCEVIRESYEVVDESMYLYPMDVISTNKTHSLTSFNIPFHNKSHFDTYFANIISNTKHTPSSYTLSYGIIESIDLFLPVLNNVLKNKKVLVISPFSESIKLQYQSDRRHKLFNCYGNVCGLTDFELLTYTTPITYDSSFIKPNYPDNSWVDTAKRMQTDISNIDFDIALIACGSYANPIIATIKRCNKQAIYLGGMLQMYFGIIGNRWLQNNPIANHIRSRINIDNFIRPIETPTNVNNSYIQNSKECDAVDRNAPEGYKAYF